MAIPTHSISCITKTYKTRCPDCQQEVWFFSCNCGSKVFFEDIGYPWEIHICKKYALRKQLEIIQDIDRLSPQEIYNIITKYEKKTRVDIDDGLLEMIEDIIGKRKYDFTCIEVYPKDQITDLSGRIMEVNNPVNILKKLGYDPNSQLSAKMLGKISRQQWLQIKIRTNLNKRNECLQFEVFLTIVKFKKIPIRKGDYISGIAEPVKHLKGIFWSLKVYKVI